VTLPTHHSGRAVLAARHAAVCWATSPGRCTLLVVHTEQHTQNDAETYYTRRVVHCMPRCAHACRGGESFRTMHQSKLPPLYVIYYLHNPSHSYGWPSSAGSALRLSPHSASRCTSPSSSVASPALVPGRLDSRLPEHHDIAPPYTCGSDGGWHSCQCLCQGPCHLGHACMRRRGGLTS
jgi:hypothetical protein